MVFTSCIRKPANITKIYRFLKNQELEYSMNLRCACNSHSSLLEMFSQTVLSLVTMRTRTDWSNEEQTHRPCLSGLQSTLDMGCVDRVTFCRRFTEPATPMSTSSAPFLVLWAGYSLWQHTNNDPSRSAQEEYEQNTLQMLKTFSQRNHLLFP